MNNKGLEALANLASAAPDQQTTGAQSAERSVANLSREGTETKNGETKGGPLHSGDQPNANVAVAGGQQKGVFLNQMTAQQLQQLITAAAAGNVPQLSGLNLGQLLGGVQQPQAPAQPDPATLLAVQQLAYYQLLMRGQTANPPVPGSPSASQALAQSRLFDPAKAAQLMLAGKQAVPVVQKSDESNDGRPTPGQASIGSPVSSGTKMPPPPPAQPVAASRPILVPPQSQSVIAPQPVLALDDPNSAYEHHLEDKKLQKRAANRRSAQLSRKRKKQFTEELKEENDDLRRKEQILKSIPDLIFVFDSTGRLWFVSQSVSRFLQFNNDELEGTSVWDRLCEDSVRLLKAAFMDSLAARQAGSDTAPLGSGLWELRLVDKDGSQKVVTLNGVVHFNGDRPECVCSIRPVDDDAETKQEPKEKVADKKEAKELQQKSLVRVKPHQSVVSNGSSDSSSSGRKAKRVRHVQGRETVRISDSGNSSGDSETASGSGSSDD